MGFFGTKVNTIKKTVAAQQKPARHQPSVSVGMTVKVAFRGDPSLGEDPNKTPAGMPADRILSVCSPADAAIECRKAIISSCATPAQWAGGRISYNGNDVASVKHNGDVILQDGTKYKGYISIITSTEKIGEPVGTNN